MDIYIPQAISFGFYFPHLSLPSNRPFSLIVAGLVVTIVLPFTTLIYLITKMKGQRWYLSIPRSNTVLPSFSGGSVSRVSIWWGLAIGHLPSWLILSCLISPRYAGAAVWGLRDAGDILLIILSCRIIRFCSYKTSLRASFFTVIMSVQYAIAGILTLLGLYRAIAQGGASLLFESLNTLTCLIALFTIIVSRRRVHRYGKTRESLTLFTITAISLLLRASTEAMISIFLRDKSSSKINSLQLVGIHIFLAINACSTLFLYFLVELVSNIVEQPTIPDSIQLFGSLHEGSRSRQHGEGDEFWSNSENSDDDEDGDNGRDRPSFPASDDEDEVPGGAIHLT